MFFTQQQNQFRGWHLQNKLSVHGSHFPEETKTSNDRRKSKYEYFKALLDQK